MKRALSKLAGLLAVVLLLSALCTTALAADTTLSFTAPSGVTFQLYSAQKNFGSTTGKKGDCHFHRHGGGDHYLLLCRTGCGELLLHRIR